MTTLTSNTKISWPSVMIASVIATVVVTITFLISGNNIVKALGMMILGKNVSTNLQYIAGGTMHLAVGIAYGILFGLFFASVRVWNKFIKGILFGFVITAVALALMPVMATVVSGSHSSASNPCAAQASNPCGAQMQNPCGMNPCGAQMQNPCGANPCNPCAGKVSNPCASGSQSHNGTRTIAMIKPSNPCVGANPCGGGAGGNATAGLISLLNHLAFGLSMAFLVRVSDSSDS